ncbi:MAG: hypothetical protein HY998_07325 [candidate division NC10 bacterium]|nr:hypothetical protein [candidate division NC10 bacterium]
MKVTLAGKRFGTVGTIVRRGRLSKLPMPPPIPENYYWLIFETGQLEEGFNEASLEATD